MPVRTVLARLRRLLREIDPDSSVVRELNQRPDLSDAEFHRRYYGDSAVTLDVVRRVRKVLAEQLGCRGLRPEDNLATLFRDTPFHEVCWEIGEEFGVEFPVGIVETLDGTIDSVIRTTQTLIDDRSKMP